MDAKRQDAPLPLQIRLFGPFDVRVEGRPLPHLRTRKGNWLLALLVLRHGREVARDWLAGTLWPDSTESQALANLRLSLTDLRRALGGQAYRLRSPTAQALCLDLGGAEADMLTFDAAIAVGDRPSLQEAVELYRGPLLEGCSEEWALSDGRIREHAYLLALEQLAEHFLTSSQPMEAISYLRQLIACDPLRESAHRRLMEAYAEDGDYAAAVSAYRELRVYLHKYVNAEPDSQTSSLFRRLRAQAQDRLRTIHDAFPPRNEPTIATPHRLPRPMSSLVGRQQEGQEVANALRVHRLVTLTGSGGIGKTRLAIAVAAEIAHTYPDGVWFVDLAALTDGALVPQVVASTLGLREHPDRSLMFGLQDYLERRTLLLILDNCEHLLPACTQLVSALLEASAHLRILATSRQLLGLTGEQTYRVPSLAFPAPTNTISVERLLEFEAVRLFTERAAAAFHKADFQVSERNAVALVSICHRLDGIPLALELAAARVRAMPVEEINNRLDKRFRLLTGGSRTALPRQQTLKALIDWSYDLLSDSEKKLLHRLSVFLGGWTLEASEQVCSGEGIKEFEVLDLLLSLADKSLVVYEEAEGKARYRLLETVRQYAAEKLEASGEEKEVKQSHLTNFLALAEESEPKLNGVDQAEWLHRLEAEHDNLRLALESSLEEEAAAVSLRLCGALQQFWWMRGHLSEGREWCVRALGRANDAERTLERAKALHGAGNIASDQGDYAGARAYYEASLSIRREVGYREGIAASLSNLGSVAYEQGDFATARAYYEESLGIRREMGDQRGIAISLVNLGNLAHVQGDYPTAQARQKESLSIMRKIGDRSGIAASLNNLGSVAYEQGDYSSARTYHEESLGIKREIGDRRGIAISLNNLGHVAYDQGDYSSARTYHEESLGIKREIGDRTGIAISLESFAALALKESRPEHAAALWGAAERLREVIGAPLPPNGREAYDRNVTAVLTAVGEEAFASAWAQGRAVSPEQAIACAVNGTLPASGLPGLSIVDHRLEG